ncbi:MAG: YggS family pyridoxal phosphate-dependent enzyme [Elusimicrobiota bacterium]|nr:YggS family pyridoxal phosphate-dependent enzyme [Elusimicrobiota bacterium]
MQSEMQLLKRYDSVLERIQTACLKSGRKTDDVKLLAVTKYALAQDIYTLLTNRKVPFIAESRLQESLIKWGQPPLSALKPIKFFIGQLQSNKIAKILTDFDIICSIDSLKLAQRINTQSEKLAKAATCLLQIKLTQKQTQGGVSMGEAAKLIADIRQQCPAVKLAGIMAIAPQTGDAEQLRPLFKEVKKFFDDNFEQDAYLSLGMSEDFEVAVQEGSNLPRIGSAIFG